MEKKRGTRLFAAALMCFAGLFPFTCLGQSGGSLPRFGIGVNAGTLGAGIQAATAVTRKSNVRFGFNYFTYSGSTTSSKDNITFNGKLKLESAEILFDQYIRGASTSVPAWRCTLAIRPPGTLPFPPARPSR